MARAAACATGVARGRDALKRVEPRARILLRRATWILVCAATVAPLVVAALPPLYDYYHWIFEGRLFASLTFGGDPADAVIAEWYELGHLPVPNMAATVVMGSIQKLAPPLVAGRVFAGLCALTVVLGFGLLVRTVQKRPTAVEILGAPWALSFFFYKGYLSYMLSAGLALGAVGVLLRATRGGRAAASRGGIAAIASLGVLLYLSHVVGWAVFFSATGLVALGIAREDRRGASHLLAALLPSAVLATWYAVGSAGERSFVLYASWSDKLRSLLEPWFLFVQTDPIPPPFPIGWAAALGLGALAVLIAFEVDRGGEARADRRLLSLASLLASLALVLPFNNFAGMNRPDGRLIFLAALVALAAVPYRPFRPRAWIVAGGLALVVSGLHVREYARAGVFLEAVRSGLAAEIPDGEPRLSIAVTLTEPDRGCPGGGGLHLGRTDTLRWFDLAHQLEGSGVRVSLMTTSLVKKRFGHDDPHDLKSVAQEDSRIPDLLEQVDGWAEQYAYAEVLGCPAGVRAASGALSTRFDEIARGPGWSLLSNRDWYVDAGQ